MLDDDPADPATPSPRHRGRGRLGGWAAAACAFLLAYVWRSRVSDSSPAILCALVVATSVIGLGIIAVGTRARTPDLLVAGVLAFTSPAVALLLLPAPPAG